MARGDAYLDHLASIPLFRALNRKELQKVSRASDETSVAEGSVVVEQGTIGRECFVIVEGSATVRRNGRKVATLGPGDYFGELSLLDHGPRTATVEADSKLTVLVLGQREFSSIIDDVPGLAHKLLASLAARIRDLDTKTFG
jgi:CRP-like cAMP-binding protein